MYLIALLIFGPLSFPTTYRADGPSTLCKQDERKMKDSNHIALINNIIYIGYILKNMFNIDLPPCAPRCFKMMFVCKIYLAFAVKFMHLALTAQGTQSKS